MVKCHLCLVKSIRMSEPHDWDSDVIGVVRKYALQNAVEYDGKGRSGSVLGRLLSERKDLRRIASELMVLVDAEVTAANSMAASQGVDAVRAELERSAPEALEREKHQKAEGLRELPGDTSSIVLRFAPNPNGPMTIGHSRGLSINSEYSRMYGGKVVLRFDDTDPKVKPPIIDAYDWIESEYEWLAGRAPDVIIRASDNMSRYLKCAEEMISGGFGYVCRCSVEDFRRLREEMKDCPCRNRRVPDTLSDWEAMNSGKIAEGDAVVRVKTSMTLPNPALRDWPALRILDATHPAVESDQYKVWPLLDFQSAIDDHDQGVTHIIRGKDLMDSTRKQTLLYEHFGWTYPQTLYWGRIKVHEFGKISKSEIKAEIEEGKFKDWDDIRLPTLSALRRRGFRGEVIRDFWIDLGISQKDISISMQTIEAFHAKRIDSSTERRSFVRDPVKLTLEGSGGPGPELSIPKHPDGMVQGSRDWTVGDSVVVQSADVNAGSIRLKEYADIVVSGESAAVDSWSRTDERPVVQWLPLGMGRDAVLHRPEGGRISSESGLLEDFELEIGEVYQLERVGFARLEDLPDEGPAKLIWLHG